MTKLSHLVADEWTAHSHPPAYEIGATDSGARRLVAGVPAGDPLVVATLAAALAPPFELLYVLHTPRGEAPPGRYQSPELDAAALRAFLNDFGPLLGSDARHDLWVRSPADGATLVWDRHNLLYAYGPLDRFEQRLRGLGFAPGRLEIPAPHTHHYRREFDPLAKQLIGRFAWHRTELQPEDVQR